MTEISIENQNDKNIDKNSSEENSTNNQTKIQNNDLLKNEVKPNDNIIEYTSSEQSNIVNPAKCKLYMFVGRTLFIFFDKYSNPIFIIGPHWPMIIFVISIISIPMLLLYFFLWKYLSFFVRLYGSIIFGQHFYLIHIQLLLIRDIQEIPLEKDWVCQKTIIIFVNILNFI